MRLVIYLLLWISDVTLMNLKLSIIFNYLFLQCRDDLAVDRALSTIFCSFIFVFFYYSDTYNIQVKDPTTISFFEYSYFGLGNATSIESWQFWKTKSFIILILNWIWFRKLVQIY